MDTYKSGIAQIFISVIYFTPHQATEMLMRSGADFPSGGVYGVLGPGCDAWCSLDRARPVHSTKFKVVRKSVHQLCTLSQLVIIVVGQVWVALY